MSRLRYFSEAELRCKCGCGALTLQPGFGNSLDDLREAWGKPLIATSVCRCPKHNRAEGGTRTSYHLTEHPGRLGTCAADFRVADGAEKGDLANLAWEMGFAVGVPKGMFVHVDGRALLFGNKKVMFGY